MAKKQEIKDTIWGNPWFQSLKPMAKLVWLYLLTCPGRENSGIFQLSVRTIHGDIENDDEDLPRSEIKEILDGMVEDGHIVISGSYVGLVDQHQHNAFLNNPKFIVNIDRQLKTVPPAILKELAPIIIPQEYHNQLSAIDSLSIGYPYNINTNTKLKQTKPNQTTTKLNQAETKLTTPPEPPEGYDAEAEHEELTHLSQRVDTLKTPTEPTENKAVKLAHAVMEKARSGAYGEMVDREDEFNASMAEAQAQEARNRKASAGNIQAQIRALDKENPNWWSQYVKISQPDLADLVGEFGASVVDKYIRLIAWKRKDKVLEP
jgi:hypothetical protein